MYKISIIIPILNEEIFIDRILSFFTNSEFPPHEIIVSDGGSEDFSLQLVRKYTSVKIHHSSKKCRATQMNEAAKLYATGEVYYFVHADVVPPKTWFTDIQESLKEKSNIGGYRFKFDSNRPLLRLNSWVTRFNTLSFRGGDQTVFISSALFKELNGYKDWSIMEEYDLIKRAKESGSKYKLIPKDVLVSARKYENNTYFKINLANLLAWVKFRLGVDHRKIKESYFRMINPPKS
ncbi:MAG: TIGR04283 family arsenosugar biosynthesis glycosyltransferase [Flavobacteriales bacterium]|jgi:rSAM/selenodomain-associated transferase 2|tara:strand:+ start:1186 stop:1890 length:705 start_codon:yes stop_codon:yes gene_type:complete